MYAGLQFDYQIRTDNGNGVVSDWTAIQTVTAQPQTADGPPNIRTEPTSTGLTVWWDPAWTIVNVNEVIWLDMSCPDCWLSAYSTKGNSMHIDGLTPGRPYGVWVATWNQIGGGVPTGGRRVIPSFGQPLIPTLNSVQARDPTTAYIDWSPAAGAVGYIVWSRNTLSDEDFKPSAPTSELNMSIGFMFPGGKQLLHFPQISISNLLHPSNMPSCSSLVL